MKKKILTLLATVALIGSTSLTAQATDDNVSYSFNIKAKCQNTYSTGRYRQTTNTSNPWKVDLAYSGEGAGTITTFWLAKYNSNHTVVSVGGVDGTHNVKQGTGAKYYLASKKASQTNVCLGAENNNNVDKTYEVSGYWDEETY